MEDKREEKIQAGEERDKEDGKRAAAVSKKKGARGGKGEGDRKRRVILAGQGQIYHGWLSEGQACPEDFCPAANSPQPSQVLSGLQLE